jgi:L-2,4-diaminobutyrate decarboxylase
MDYGAIGFQSMFNARPEPAALWAQEEVARLNQGVTAWEVSPGGALLEEMFDAELCRLFGWPEGTDATFLYSGSYANQQALFMSLHRAAERRAFDFGTDGLAGFNGRVPMIVASADAHLSVKACARMLGLGARSVIEIPVDASRRMDVAALATALDQNDVACVVATLGTTNCGAIDPIAEIAELCASHGVWLHVDAAYGGAYTLLPELANARAAMVAADSLTWDPHKAMRVPIPSSVLFVRHGDDFRRMSVFGEYINRQEDAFPAPGLKSLPTTRPNQALPLLLTMRHLGLDGVRAALRAPLVAARTFHEWLRHQPEFETAHPPETGIVCFRLVGGEDPDARNRHAFETVLAGGSTAINMTRFDGRVWLRTVTINPLVTGEDLIASARMAAET